MVQRLLIRKRTSSWRNAVWAVTLCLLLVPTVLFAKDKGPRQVQLPPDLLLEGGRRLSFERVLTSEKDVRGPKGFWKKLVDVVAGEAEYKPMLRPYSVAVDSHGRVIVTDPGLGGFHVFDVEQHKYKFLQREDKGKNSMLEPQCVAVDANDTIYVTDSKAGKVFIWAASGKYKGTFGSLKGGEGFFKRPTGIAIDRETQDIYVTDTLRDHIYVLDPQGQVVRTIGQHGEQNGEFNFPTELLVKNGVLAVVDAMNFRVQTFDRKGLFQSTIGDPGDSSGALFRPKGIGLDSENHIYLVEGFRGSVQVFDRGGQLLYEFGGRGTQLGHFQLPAGLFIDQNDRVYVVDSYNRRVQVFQYHGVKTSAQGSKP
jgi:DNA-binding beta-propeller fold protein YncE